MSARSSLQTTLVRAVSSRTPRYVCQHCRRASTAAYTPAPSDDQLTASSLRVARYPPEQPPSLKPAEFRKTQLHRQYQSLIRSAPLILLFQHNNIKSPEWIGMKRELSKALRKVDEDLAKNGDSSYIGQSAKLQVVQTGLLASAMRVVEFWEPKYEEGITGLSRTAWQKCAKKDQKHGLEALLSGPIAILAFPSVSPQHVKAALSILAPTKAIPAPKRRAGSTYYEPAVQSGLVKLMFLGARVEGEAMDFEKARWLAGIEGGLAGLRAQLVNVLQGAGSSLTTTLDAAGKSLYITMESRKTMLEEESTEKTQ